MTRLGGKGLRRRGLGIAVGALALLALPSAASAASVSFDGATIQYAAAPGETNQLAIAASGTDVVLSDPGAGTLVDADGAGGCSVSGSLATCPLTSFAATHVTLGGGDDTASSSGNLAPITAITIDAGAGADTVLGSNGADTLLGASGADFIDGNQGNDTAFGGTGTDTFQWDPGDGSDILEGQENLDTLRFNGSNINEKIELSANGPRLRLTRDVATIVMDISGVEAVDVQSFGGADTTTVNDLTGTGVRSVTDDLSAFGGGGDGAADDVIVNGTSGHDVFNVAGTAAAGVDVTGPAAATHIRGQEPSDRLDVHTLAGADAFNTDALEPGAIQFFID